jgi:signal transduction histidine kinase
MNESNSKSLNLMLSNVEKMDLLIEGVLDYSSIDKQENNNRIIDINLLVDEILITTHLAEHVAVTINNKLPKVFGNNLRFKQLFQNLIENGIKYNNKEKILIELGHSENDNEFCFYVKDNGVGIPEKYQTKVFNIFFKLENNDTSPGIGLSIVKKIVSLYKGRVWLESQENKGTILYFTISKKNGTA